jgi:hypothetical protein
VNAGIVDNDTTAAIDSILSGAWKTEGLKTSAEVDDALLLRRAMLDIVGRIPTRKEIQDFENDKRANKRERWIDQLVASDEAAAYWSHLWTNWLLVAPGEHEMQVVEEAGKGEVLLRARPLPHPVYQEQLRGWLHDQFVRNRGWDQVVTELLTAQGASHERPAAIFLLMHVGADLGVAGRARQGQFDMVPATRQTLRLFLGLRTDGLPEQDRSASEELILGEFWGINAFFRQTTRDGSPDGKTVLTLRDSAGLNESGFLEYTTPRGEKKKTAARFLGGKIAEAGKASRREMLARYVVSHDNFARAYVSRVWGHFFGRGFHARNDVDDFGNHHKIVHPTLLNRLANDFVKSRYDHRKLVRSICASRAYGLGSRLPDPQHKERSERYFANMALKPLNAYQLERSLLVALVVNKKMDERARIEERLHKAIQECRVPGRSDFDELNLTLWLQNSRDLHDLLVERTRVAVRQTDGAIDAMAKDFFLSTLARAPTSIELRHIAQNIRPVLIPEHLQRADAVGEDLLWALLQSNEFIINH